MVKKNFELPILVGESAPNTAVLFIHGLGGSYKTWGKFARHLKLSWVNSTSYSIKYDEYYPNEMWYDKIPIISDIIKVIRQLPQNIVPNLLIFRIGEGSNTFNKI